MRQPGGCADEQTRLALLAKALVAGFIDHFMKLRVAAILCAICAVASYPVSALIFPAVQRMSGFQMPDGSVVIPSPTAGTWVFKLGIVAAVGFLVAAIVLFSLSRRRQGL